MIQHKISSSIIAAVGIVVCYISFTQQPSEAYLFPRLISIFFVTFAVWTSAKAWMGKSKVGDGLSREMFANMAPGLIVATIYILWAAKNVGFYTSSVIAFFILLSLYDPADHALPKSWIKRVVITAGFMAVMYLLFAVVLKVYTPRGMFI
jgi:hypothetical protein